ncbi:hypothetical protein ABKN59_007471 [Abortiporus biennis]
MAYQQRSPLVTTARSHSEMSYGMINSYLSPHLCDRLSAAMADMHFLQRILFKSIYCEDTLVVFNFLSSTDVLHHFIFRPHIGNIQLFQR